MEQEAREKPGNVMYKLIDESRIQSRRIVNEWARRWGQSGLRWYRSSILLAVHGGDSTRVVEQRTRGLEDRNGCSLFVITGIDRHPLHARHAGHSIDTDMYGIVRRTGQGSRTRRLSPLG